MGSGTDAKNDDRSRGGGAAGRRRRRAGRHRRGSDPPYFFSGRGRAHGVGMCMDGALYRAYDGWSYHDIINYYYTGIQFGRADDNQPIRVKGRDGQIRTWTMHDYLYHLQEEPESCPMEDLKVLYVAARTYALSCIARGKHAKEGFDICSSGDCCQACDENKDLSKYPKNCAAVDATAGEIITYDGKPITAAYCGSCGGHTENNEDVWGGSAIPYLRGKPDTYCQRSSRYAWNVTMKKSEVEARLNSSGDTAVGTLYAMDLSNRTPGGRVATGEAHRLGRHQDRLGRDTFGAARVSEFSFRPGGHEFRRVHPCLESQPAVDGGYIHVYAAGRRH